MTDEVVPLNDKLKGQQAYLSPGAAEWLPLTEEAFTALKSADEADDEQVRANKAALSAMFASALQIPNLGFFAGSGTSLGAVGGPSMWELWQRAMCPEEQNRLSERAAQVADTVRYLERNNPNIEHFLSQCDAYLAFNSDAGVSAFVKETLHK